MSEAKTTTTKTETKKAPKAATKAAATKTGAGSGAIVSYDAKANHLQVNSSAVQMIENMKNLNDSQLLSLFSNIVNSEKAMFVVRGAAASELYSRAMEAGKDFNKTKGGGVDALVNEIAKEVGVDGKTLYADFKVFQEFGGLLIEKLATAPDTILPREFYVLAMKTTHAAKELPSTVLGYFEEQREATGGYFTDHARRDAKLINDGKTVEEVKKLDAKERKDKIAGKATKAVNLSGPREANVKILATEQNITWYDMIITKHGSFEAWYVKKCKEEFGETDKAAKAGA